MLKLRHHQNFTNPRSNTSDKKKAYRDYQQDGLMEVMRGWILLTFGGFFHSTVLTFYILLIIFYGKIVEFIRRRYTYPTIRFVKFREKNPKDALTGVFLFELAVIVIIFTLISISGDVTDYFQWVNWAPLFFGMVLVGPFAHAASGSGNVRYYGYVILSAIMGLFLFSIIWIRMYRINTVSGYLMGIFSPWRSGHLHPLPAQISAAGNGGA